MVDETDKPASSITITKETSIKISFGVKRKEALSLITPSAEVTSVHVESDEERDAEELIRVAKKRKLERFENGNAPKDEDEQEKKYVIPAVVDNDWRIAKLMEKQENGTITDEEKARLAILTEDRPFNLEGDLTSSKHVIKIGGDDVKVAEDADYKSIPIEQFGLAILRGCGWKEGSGIGRNPKVVQLQVNAQRPKGLGLGATPKLPQKQKTDSKDDVSGDIIRGSLVKFLDRRNIMKYGKVESRDDDNNCVYVRLALGGASVKISLCSIQKVSQKEYERDGKCVNKAEYDAAKVQIDKKCDELEKDIKKKEKDTSNEIYIIDSKEGPSREASSELWVRPQLIVRFIDKEFNRGKLYKQKLRVVDVASRKDISLEDDYGQIYYNLKQNWIETVIPRREGDRIMVVRGRYKGSPAIMEKKDKKRDRVSARLLDRDNKIVELDFDDVCSFQPKYDEDYDV